MPISPAYEWSETSTTLTITAQCRGATTAATDVFSSPHYVSANSPPYFLEVDLHGAIDSTRSVANVRQGVITLKLTKALEAKWGRLLVDLPRDQRLKRREASRQLAAQEAQAALERKKRAGWDDSRFSLTKQMDKDRANRERIESLKKEELEKEQADLERWQAETEGRKPSKAKPAGGQQAGKKASAASRSKPLVVDDDGDSRRIVDITDDLPPLAERGDPMFNQPIFDDDEDEDEEEATATGTGDRKSAGSPAPAAAAAAPVAATPATKPAAAAAPAAAALPPPRTTGRVKIGFTKQLLTAPARTKTNNADYDLPLDPLTAPEIFQSTTKYGDISQRDPAWLKDRADRYFRMGDYRSAEEAYSMVLTQFATSIMGQAIDCVVACWSNRAVCKLHRRAFLDAVDDCGHALNTMAKARCVTEAPKSEAAHVRCRMRLLSKRGAAYAGAGVLHRALTDLRVAVTMADGPMPSDAADKQMLATDVQALLERHEKLIALLNKADGLLAEAQPAVAVHVGGTHADALSEADPDALASLREARELYTEALGLASCEVSALANRAACALFLGEAHACTSDCTAALAELDAETRRAEEIKAERTGMCALPQPPAELTELTDDLTRREPTLRFELLRRRAASRMEESELMYPQAAIDLKEALKLRPADTQVVMALDDLSRRAGAAGVDLEPLPPTMPGQLALTDEGDGEESEDDDEEAAGGGEQGGEQGGGGEAAGEAVGAAEAGAAAGAAAPSSKSTSSSSSSDSKPPVGPRSAAGLKTDADNAFREARLGKAITLYGKALKADSQAEWMGEGKGILFRCQCLANRAACQLKMHAFGEAVNDAGAAIAALGTGLVSGEQAEEGNALLLKLLARRGMALCQLTRYDEAAADYGRAVELDPSNAQLQQDLKLIEGARKQ